MLFWFLIWVQYIIIVYSLNNIDYIRKIQHSSINLYYCKCWLATLEVSWIKSESGPWTWRARRAGERCRALQVLSDSFNDQGNLHTKLVLGNCKMSISLQSPTRILKVYRAHTHSPRNTTPCSLKTESLKTALTVWKVSKTYSPRTREGAGAISSLGLACKLFTADVLSMSSSNILSLRTIL